MMSNADDQHGFSQTTTIEEKTDESLALAKNFLENMNDELDESVLWARLMNKFAGTSPEEIQGKYNASITEFTATMLGVLPSVDYSDLDQSKDLSPPIIATDPATREFISMLREGLPDMRSTKGQPWSNEEHCLFLMGMKSCGKGDWRSISKYFVLSRTPTQIASHAQKFFTRQDKEKRRRALRLRDNMVANSFSAARAHLYAAPYSMPPGNAYMNHYRRSTTAGRERLAPPAPYALINRLEQLTQEITATDGGGHGQNPQRVTTAVPPNMNMRQYRSLMPAPLPPPPPPPLQQYLCYPGGAGSAAAMAQDPNMFGMF